MKKLLFFFLSVSLLLACTNNEKTPGAEPASNPGTIKTARTGDNQVVFTVNGERVETSGWNIGYFDMGAGNGKQINITSNMHEDPRTVMFNINGDKPGTYVISSGMDAGKPGIAYGSYRPDYNKDMQDVYSFESGEFIIESLDVNAKTLNASFHGSATNTKGQTITITDGKVINGKLKL